MSQTAADSAPVLSILPLPERLRPAIVDLWVASWQATLPEIDFEARREWFRGRLDETVAAGASLLVALDGTGRPLGLVLFDPATGWLDQLAVVSDAQGSGVASALLDAAKGACPEGLSLDVNEANLRARRFYAREGFVEMGRGANPLSGLPTLALRWTPR